MDPKGNMTMSQCIDPDTANCANQAGVYHGDGTTCAQANCPSPGACCLEDGTCIQATPAACAIQNGVYHGDSSVCGTCGLSEW